MKLFSQYQHPLKNKIVSSTISLSYLSLPKNNNKLEISDSVDD